MLGQSQLSENRAWRQMKYRCLNSRCKSFADYGGRGISVFPEWVTSFSSFLACIGTKPHPDMSLDRIDNEKGYEPGNVRWATPLRQARNRRMSVFLTHQGRTQHIRDWADELGIGIECIRHRLRVGRLTMDQALDPSYVYRPKLSDGDMAEIKEMLSAGISGAEIATRFGITASRVSQIKLGKTGRRVEHFIATDGRE